MDSIQPIQKQKRVLSEDALTKLAAARVKALEARKHNCAVRREAKAQAQTAASTVPAVTPAAPPVSELVSESVAEPAEVFPSSPVRVRKQKPAAVPRRRQKIVLYSDSDSDDEAIYIKTKRKNPKTTHRSPPRKPSPQKHPSPVHVPPTVEPSVPTQPLFTMPDWMKM